MAAIGNYPQRLMYFENTPGGVAKVARRNIFKIAGTNNWDKRNNSLAEGCYIRQRTWGDMVMKVAITASGKNLTSLVDPRFGRCLYFIIVETTDMTANVYPNQSSGLRGSAGIQAAAFLSEKDVSAVITGHCGPNASLSLRRTGIQLYEGQGGVPITRAMEKFINGDLTASGDVSPLSYDRYCMAGEELTFGRRKPNVRSCAQGMTQSKKAAKTSLKKTRPTMRAHGKC